MDADGENLQAANLTGVFKPGLGDPIPSASDGIGRVNILIRSALSLHTNPR
jgi:hypothetical protein